MAENRLVSLDAALPAEDGENLALSDVLPDLNAIREEEQRRLMLNLDQALEQLTPQLRDVLVARFLIGESCAAIGARFGRTEQTISAWVRQAIREMKRHFGAAGFGAALKDEK
jgi:RNA polymerase sigma factor (sigma-70 family)